MQLSFRSGQDIAVVPCSEMFEHSRTYRLRLNKPSCIEGRSTVDWTSGGFTRAAINPDAALIELGVAQGLNAMRVRDEHG